MADLQYLTINQAHELLVQKKVTAVGLVQYYLDRIHNYNPRIKAVLTICEELALKQARGVDKRIKAGEQIGLLEGIPYTAKDMFLTKGIRTTASSKILENYIPPYSASAVNSLEGAGAVLIAKVNQDEFAHGGSTENSGFHPTHNPWNDNYVPGGSSGGSAAAVASDFGIFSLGTDTGGSIRQPATYCGVTGFKPTYGLVSRYGVVAMASSFDCVGPITRSAEDALIVLTAIAGRDTRDSTTIESSIAVNDRPSVKSVKAFELESLPESQQAIDIIGKLGIDIENSKEQMIDEALALAVYYILVPSEISSNLERYDGVRYGKSSQEAHSLFESYTKTRGEGFGEEVKRRNIIGTYALSAGYYDAYYKKAMQVRTTIIRQLDKHFDGSDLLVCPTTIGGAFKFGSKSDPIEMYKTDILTVVANLTGAPAISIPIGVDEAGLPLGLQIIGRRGEDTKVLSLAQQIQSKSDWHNMVKEIMP